MIDVCPYHIGSLLNLVFSQDSIEHYREEEEFESLDFSCELDARYAIRRWIDPCRQIRTHKLGRL